MSKIAGFVTREQAGLVPPRSVSRNITPQNGGVAAHYGGGPQRSGVDNADHSVCLAVWRSYQNHHMRSNGWADVAYTGAFCNHGFAFAGRGVNIRTAANGTNAGNQNFYAIVWLGGGNQRPTPLALDAADWWVTNLRNTGGAGLAVKPHNAFRATPCPGQSLVSWARSRDNTQNFIPPRPAPTPTPAPSTPVEDWRGKRVVAKQDVRFYKTPGWHPANRQAGILKAGWGFRGGIHTKARVGGGWQYQVSNSSGHRFWITASDRFVDLRPM